MKRSQYKRIWFILIKFSIVLGAGFYIYKRVFVNTGIDKKEFLSQLDGYLFQNWCLLALIVGMTLLNWLLEIWKWQTLVTYVQPISFVEASKQSLSSHTISLITPFKIGEYGGKVVYFPRNLRKRILMLNFIGNAAQLLMTLLFGIVGFLFFLNFYEVKIAVFKLRRLAYLITGLIIVSFAEKKMGSKYGFGYFRKALMFFEKMSWKTKGKTLIFAFLRYVIFSHQFYLLFLVFGVDVTYEVAILLIFAMYFLATFLPVFSLFDFVIKGSIALYLFSFVGISDVKIISISTLMWLLNFVIPAVVGSYFVLTFKPNFKTKFA